MVAVAAAAAVMMVAVSAGPAAATPYGGVEFPAGAPSFADTIAAYDPGTVSNEPNAASRIRERALGPPDCEDAQDSDCYVSLGDGGSVTIQFTDNRLRGSGDSGDDLYIFEVGPAIEAMFVEISTDGQTFQRIGSITGQPSGIDIDAFGFGPQSEFAFVRVIDDTDQDAQNGPTVGADIDAVGAISSGPPPPPAPASSPAPARALPRTGAEVAPWLALGLNLLIGGAALTLVDRRRSARRS